MSTELRAARDTHLVAWRRDQLAKSGFPLPLASQVARDSRYDVHSLIGLVERGCPTNLAVRIAAPLDEGHAA